MDFAEFSTFDGNGGSFTNKKFVSSIFIDFTLKHAIFAQLKQHYSLYRFIHISLQGEPLAVSETDIPRESDSENAVVGDSEAQSENKDS